MTHPVAIHAIKVQKIAHKVLKALGFINLNILFKRGRSVPAAFLPKLPHSPTATHTKDTRTTFEESQQTIDPLQISIADWDILFQAIQLRLRNAVNDRPPSALPPEPGDTAGQIQIAVLECITAMEQLHIALAHERRTRAN